ncbi:MAG: glycosyltransferase [Candidatus Omnitrophota bacterium]|nr:glycosyltransferase [Candidatus Omnitrophota bacterium]
MKKIRLAYFQQNLALGATEEYLYYLMRGIDRARFDPEFIYPENAVFEPLISKLRNLDVKVSSYCLQPNHVLLIKRLRELFLDKKPSLAHFNDTCLDGIIAARLAGVPVLLMTHHTPELNPSYNIKARFIKKIAFRYCGLRFIFTSEFDRDTGIRKEKIASDKSYVIYYGLPAEKFQDQFDKKDVYREFSLEEGCRIIVNIARLAAQKGQKYLIDAASFVVKRFKSVKFFFIGEGELEDELKARVKHKGLEDYFIFTGYRTDIPRLLNASDVLVMPSLFEGLCFAVIEAQAMGVPVIATSVGGMRRSVVDGKTGILVKPADVNALAEAMLWMLEHQQQAGEMGLTGKKHFRELFTLDKMIKETESLYKNLLGV